MRNFLLTLLISLVNADSMCTEVCTVVNVIAQNCNNLCSETQKSLDCFEKCNLSFEECILKCANPQQRNTQT